MTGFTIPGMFWQERLSLSSLRSNRRFGRVDGLVHVSLIEASASSLGSCQVLVARLALFRVHEELRIYGGSCAAWVRLQCGFRPGAAKMMIANRVVLTGEQCHIYRGHNPLHPPEF